MATPIVGQNLRLNSGTGFPVKIRDQTKVKFKVSSECQI
jgi:hypothetical protein